MELLKAAKVETGGERWSLGANKSARECGVLLELEDACDPTTIALRGTVGVVPGTYRVQPFALRGILLRSNFCALPDDDAWWSVAFTKSLEFALTRALVIQPIAGSDSWVGNAGVQTVALGATPTDAALATAVMAGRNQWFSTVTSIIGDPIMHVPPSLAPALVRGGVLFGTPDGEIHSVTGDPVVVGDGYDIPSPHVFFTSDIVIYLMPKDDEGGPLPHARVNDMLNAKNIIAEIDTPPCGIVRVGS